MAHLIQSSAVISLISSDCCYFEFQDSFLVEEEENGPQITQMHADEK